jgi:hypothetical protein
LKTFLTQFGPALPLTPDPTVRLRDDQKGGTTIEIIIWRAFLPKTNSFSHPPRVYPPPLTRLGHFPLPVSSLPTSYTERKKSPSRRRPPVCPSSLLGSAAGALLPSLHPPAPHCRLPHVNPPAGQRHGHRERGSHRGEGGAGRRGSPMVARARGH